ncbi:MAG: S-methyl-5-thioribose-1-phosphate isomerase [Candidatus Bathyarchaeota archaeon]|nr:S-methyl-5-thioribose-1-phosphate isomerase [Candidatus Bathyarchaeota archaeon]
MRTIEWNEGIVTTIDQTKLPHEEIILKIRTLNEMAEAIRNMRVRGAPLLGASAAYGLALTAFNSRVTSKEEFIKELKSSAQTLKATRPTAVNLFWALDRILKKIQALNKSFSETKQMVIQEAQKIADEDAKANRAIGKHGAELIDDGDIILTHCNAGALATVEYGTALGVIRAAWEQGKKIQVIATETRPLLQGARLTVYELKRDGIPVKLITDNMAGFIIQKKIINKVVVGADRIVQDAIINKIGTFSLAVIANEFGVPFYVAAPKSTFDLSKESKEIVIEERKREEVTHFGSQPVAVSGVEVYNPAFDITPYKYVSGIIHEDGVFFKKDFRTFRNYNSAR